MNINSLSQKYSVRKLDENDVDIIYDMSCKNDIFYQYHPPFVTRESILDDMGALPPGKGYDDKFYVGFFENDSLVGLMDLILDYPEKEISFIGFTIIHKGFSIYFLSSEIFNSRTGADTETISLGLIKQLNANIGLGSL